MPAWISWRQETIAKICDVIKLKKRREIKAAETHKYQSHKNIVSNLKVILNIHSSWKTKEKKRSWQHLGFKTLKMRHFFCLNFHSMTCQKEKKILNLPQKTHAYLVMLNTKITTQWSTASKFGKFFYYYYYYYLLCVPRCIKFHHCLWNNKKEVNKSMKLLHVDRNNHIGEQSSNCY